MQQVGGLVIAVYTVRAVVKVPMDDCSYCDSSPTNPDARFDTNPNNETIAAEIAIPVQIIMSNENPHRNLRKADATRQELLGRIHSGAELTMCGDGYERVSTFDYPGWPSSLSNTVLSSLLADTPGMKSQPQRATWT